jgi:hypothetical protein
MQIPAQKIIIAGMYSMTYLKYRLIHREGRRTGKERAAEKCYIELY